VVEVISLDDKTWRVTVVAYDYPGELSVICGLLFVHGFDISDGYAFTYEPIEQQAGSINGSDRSTVKGKKTSQKPHPNQMLKTDKKSWMCLQFDQPARH
jgi:hypothetical protein